MRKKWNAFTKFLARVGDLPMHILVFRLWPAVFITSGLITAIVIYATFALQNLARWTGDSIDRLQALISVHGF